MNRISELRKKLGLTQIRLGEEIGVSQQTISKYENVDENISGDMLLALSKFFKVPVDYILRKDEEEQQREQDNKREIMELYTNLKEKRLMSFPDNNERGRGENPLSFLLLFCAILRTEVVKGISQKVCFLMGDVIGYFFISKKYIRKF